MKYLPLLLLFASGAFHIASNAKAVVKKFELKEDNMFSRSVIALIKTYQGTINTNYKKELLVANSWRLLANLSLVLAFTVLFT